MYGDNIMVLPNHKTNNQGNFYFPTGEWVSIYPGGDSTDYPDRVNSEGEL